jgi:alanine dehydrogenase
MRLISERDVERLIDPATAIAVVAESYRRQAAKHVPEPGRLDLARQRPRGNVLVLAGHSDKRLFAAKINLHVYPDALSLQRLASSMMLLWDTVACAPLALIATTGFNNHRTAAGLAAAVQRLAPLHAATLVVFGAGKIAPAVIRYLAVVRQFKRILILSHNAARSHDLADRVARWTGFEQCTVSAATDAEAAASMADVIVTITTSNTPVFPGAAVKKGGLVVLAGANRPDAREADDFLIGRAQIYVDHLTGCISRAGDLAIPLESGHLQRCQIIGEIGLALAEDFVTQRAGADVTVFKSIGIIGQDIALGELILRRAQLENIGSEFNPQNGHCITAAAVQRSVITADD